MKVLIATKNSGKIKMYSEILDELNIEHCSLKDFDVDVKVEESGKTTKENAILKAMAYHKAFDMPVLCNDSGFFIKKLKKDEQPGVFVRRQGNKELSDEEMISAYKEMIEKVGGKSKSYFLVSLAIIDSKHNLHIKNFKSPRLMLSKDCKTRIKDFPLRSLQYSVKARKYFAEMTMKEANEVDSKNISKQSKFIQKFLK